MMLLSAPIYQLKRRAKLLARKTKIPLHEAQDRIAHDEGFPAWSALSASIASGLTPISLLPSLTDGDMLLLGARPGHGKTMLGMRLLIDAAREGRRSVFFTLEYTEQEVIDRIHAIDSKVHVPEIVTSEEISADFIIRHLATAQRGTVAVIDYLQILDQQRTKPALGEQVERLSQFAQTTGVILAFISQVDRSFDTTRGTLPRLTDLRLPNAVPSDVFTKACFLHAGQAHLQGVTRT